MKIFFSILFFCNICLLKAQSQIVSSDSTLILKTDNYSNFKPQQKTGVNNTGTIALDSINKSSPNNPDGASIIALNYESLSNKAVLFFKKKDYSNAITYFNKAIAANNNLAQVTHRYQLAVSYAQLSQPDKALEQLERIVFKGGYFNYIELSDEASFEILHANPSWKIIVEKTKKNAAVVESKLNTNIDE